MNIMLKNIRLAAIASLSILLVGCGPNTYSAFGEYQQLPDWSDWCPANSDASSCTSLLKNAVKNQSKNSRKTVRAHGWKLWAGIISPLDGTGYDSLTNTSTFKGTKGCWSKSSKGDTACSGVYPIWYSWPNTGLPYSGSTSSKPRSGLLKISHDFAAVGHGSKRLGATQVSSDPDPRTTQTVNTQAPTYRLPALTLFKQCNIVEKTKKDKVKKWLKTAYTSKDDKKDAWTKLEDICKKYGVVCASQSGICDGSTFVNQGDVMIATESLSKQAWDSVQKNKIYANTSTLKDLYEKGDATKAKTQVAKWFNNEFISTKHMYWPVKGCKPGVPVGQADCRVRYGALPPWVPANFKNINYATNADYLGYEKWGKVVAIDTCGGGSNCGKASSATLVLEDVFDTKSRKPVKSITTSNPDVYPISNFVHVQMSQEVLDMLSATDKALLDQATIWAYGSDSNGFEAGDFLVVAAMHVTTKEIDSWTFQSVWWSPMKDTHKDCPLKYYNNCFGQSDVYNASAVYSGLSHSDRTTLDNNLGSSVWQDHYLLSDSYGINYEIDGKATNADNYFKGTPPIWATQTPEGKNIKMLPVAMNVYIEPVIHPLGTNCQNCHRRAGVVHKPPQKGEYADGVGRANYQNAQCPSLLGDYGMPANSSCFTAPWAWNKNAWKGKAENQCKKKNGTWCKGSEAYPIVNTDLSWFVADGHVQGAKQGKGD